MTGPYGAGKSSFAVFLRALLGPNGPVRAAADELLRAANSHMADELSAARARAGAESRGFVLAATTCQPESAIGSLLRSLDHGTRAYWPTRRPAEVSHALARANVGRTSREVADAVMAISERAPVLLLLDEFGKTLEHFTTHAAVSTEADLFVLQEIAELATDRQRPVLLLTLQHLAFDDYVRTSSVAQRREWGKIAGRFEDVPFLETAEQSLRLIAGAVTDGQGIDPVLVDRRRTWAINAQRQLVQLGLDARLPGGADTLESAYPLHPAALLALPDLCARLGQHGRTLFTFLASSEAATLGAFLEATPWPVVERARRPGAASRSKASKTSQSPPLPELRLSDVFDFFTGPGRALTAAAGQRWVEIDTRIREAHGLDDDDLRCLKVVGLLNLLADSAGTRASADLVGFALSSADGPADPGWRRRLEDLEARGWLTYRGFADEYRLWQGTDVDLRTRVADAREQLRTTSAATLLNTLHAGNPVIAGKHTQRVGMLRYFVPSYADPTQRSVAALPAEDPADGQLVHFLGSPEQATSLTVRDPGKGGGGRGLDTRPVVMAVSTAADRVIDAAVEAAAALAVLDQQDVAADRVARRELQDRAADARRRLSVALEEAYRPGAPGVAYLRFAGKGWEPVDAAAGLSRLLSDVCEDAYSASPEIRNEMLGRRELTSQGAKARRQLLEAMVSNSHVERLGLSGYGPERAMYEAVLHDTRMHVSAADGTWGFAAPAPGSTLNHAWGVMTVSTGHGRPVSVADIYTTLKAPPIGLKDGPIPVLLTAWLLHRADDIAVYEEGTYQPELSADLLERLVKAPQRFAVKEFDLAGPRAKVLTAVLEAADMTPSARISGRNATVLRAAAPLLSAARALPAFTKSTKKALSDDAERVRDALLRAREPDLLLFESLPEACGLPPITPGRPRTRAERAKADALVDTYASRLSAALGELAGAFEATLSDCATALSDELSLRDAVPELREDLRVRARALTGEVLEPRLRSFLLTAAGIDLDDAGWLEAIALTVAGRPPAAWTDDDLARYHVNLHQLATTFQRVEALHFQAAARANDGFTARRIAITEPDGHETSEVVWLDHASADLVDELADDVLDRARGILGANGPRALLAALADRALARAGEQQSDVSARSGAIGSVDRTRSVGAEGQDRQGGTRPSRPGRPRRAGDKRAPHIEDVKENDSGIA
ncbi:hypothetical protein [Nocardioides sp.]|uniref:hypothetical protein n=1 Tax=Nocardioides sp. TaxID=35761 RepID=UPI002736E617|nr:hypothetical protein [Nocardioides sp.]MDP3893335.1 hypothetical protein [Nocardioides sp.]